MPDIKFSNQYPYTDFHELNLEWVIKEVKYWSTKVGKTIQSIELTGTAGLVDTYTITYSDGSTSTFDVTNGNGITSVAKTGTVGLVDTYTITFQDGSTSTFDVHNGTASIDPTFAQSDYAADAKATGDAIFKTGNALTFPSTYTGKANVTAISGKILTGGHNIIKYIGLVDGVYSNNGVTITVSGNEISLTGTASASIYFAPHLGAFVASGAALAVETTYDLPALQYRFGAKFTNLPNNVALSVRSRISGSVLVTNPLSSYADGIYDHSTWGEIYVYIPSGANVTDGKIVFGLVPTSITNSHLYFPEYNDITGISVIGHADLSVYSILGGTATVYEVFNKIDELRSELELKRVYIKYISGSGSDASTERVEIYVPSVVGFIRYDFLHTVDIAKNADVWRIGYAFAVDDTFTERFALTTAGEWECALKLKDRPDFSGGFAHGDEIVNDVTFFVNGVPVDITDFTDRTAVDSLVVVEVSTLYDPDDSVTAIASHGSEHIFKDKVTINQSVTWLVSERVASAYLAMFPPAKTVTNSMYTNKDYNIVTVDGTPQAFPKVTSINIYSEPKGFNALFKVDKYPSGLDVNADYFLTTDNGGGSYNKCYYVIATAGGTVTPSVNEEWKSETVYDLQISK